MKIIYIHQHFKRPSEPGGSRPWENARRLASEGHDVLMITGGTSERRYDEAGFQVLQLQADYRSEMRFFSRILSFVKFALAASLHTVRTPADLVLASSTPLTVAVPALLKHGLQGTPFIFEVRDLWPSVPIELGFLKNPFAIQLSRALELLAYRRAHHIVALSPGMAKGVLERHPSALVSVIPNAADLERYSSSSELRNRYREKLGWRENEIVCVYAGSFGWTYNLSHLVEIAAHLKETAVHFVLLGAGPSSAALRELAVARGLDANSLLPGNVSKDEAAKNVIAGDIVLSSIRNVPPLQVNSLNKVFDGLAAGKPVAFTHDGWLSSLVTAAGAGVRLSPDDPAEAASVLVELASDTDRRQVMGAKARALAVRHFDRDSLFGRLADILDGIESHSGRRRSGWDLFGWLRK